MEDENRKNTRYSSKEGQIKKIQKKFYVLKLFYSINAE